MSAAGDDNDDPNPIFYIKETKLYVSVNTLSAKDTHKLSKLFRKGFERSVYWNEYKTKNENKNAKTFLESNYVRVIRLQLI